MKGKEIEPVEVIPVPEKDKLVNVAKAIKDKNPRLYKWLPNFVLNWLKRLVHEDEINSIMYRNRMYHGTEFVHNGLKEMELDITYEGLENIPNEGGVFLTANHPLGGLDGVALIDVVAERRKDLKFFVNDILMQIKNFQPIFVPVNKHGANSPHYKKKFEEVYSSENCLLIFPAGLVSRRQKDGTIRDLQWKKSTIQKAIEHDRPIVPVFIDGKNSKKFYNIAYYRKKLGIKTNFEMLFLADEMFKQRGESIHIIFGKPIPSSHFTSEKKPAEWINWLKNKVYEMGDAYKSSKS